MEYAIIKEEQLSNIENKIQILKKNIGLSNDREMHANEIVTENMSLLYENIFIMGCLSPLNW